MDDKLSWQLNFSRSMRRRPRQRMAVNHGPGVNPALIGTMGSAYDDLPIDPRDYDAFEQENTYISTFESACYHGPLPIVQAIVSANIPPPPRTRSFLHHGLIVALYVGNIDIAQYLLSAGAPILRATPRNIFSAPSDQQIPLFELLLQHGWTVNTPGYYGAVLLPQVVDKPHLLRWFLLHGANPNLGEQRDNRDRTGGPDTDSCAALETAAGQGNTAAVRLLLDAGAEIQNGIPLHYAAGTCPPGTNPYDANVTASKEFDQSRIPAMALLVERGADVNQEHKSRHIVARYAILRAVMAGAVERVRWLLEHGADPELTGPYGNAVTYATRMRSEEMRSVLDEWVRAKKVNK